MCGESGGGSDRLVVIFEMPAPVCHPSTWPAL